MDDLSIDQLDMEDLDAVAPLWECVRRQHRDVSDVEVDMRTPDASWLVRRSQYQRWLETGGFVLVARSGERIVGYAAVVHVPPSPTWQVDEAAEVASLSVAPSFREAGVGTRLLDACADRLAAEGVGHMLVTVVEGNDRAAALYRRSGFAPLARTLLRPTATVG